MIKYLLENKELINVLSGIGTFISSIIAIYTLREVIKQRLSTYKPEILIKSFVVYINKSPLELKSDELLQYYSTNFNEYSNPQNLKNKYSGSCLYKVENFGFGPAEKIKCIWKFDTKRALSLLEKEFNEDYYFSQYKKLNYYFLKNRKNDSFHFSITNENKTIQTIDYLAPINIKEHTHFHCIPNEIVVTHYLYYIFKKKLLKTINENNYGYDFKELPKPALKIEYEDLNGKSYTKNYEFEISLVVTQINEHIDLSNEFGYLLFKIT